MAFSYGVEQLASISMGKRGAAKLAMHHAADRWYLVASHYWSTGWTIVDVTAPERPEVVRWVEGPSGSVAQVQVADGILVHGVYQVPGWGFDGLPGTPPERGLILWDLSDVERPARLGAWTGADGTHRNFYDGGRYVHAATELPGYRGEVYAAIDIDDPTNPSVVGTWGWPGQHEAAGEKFSERDEAMGRTGRPFRNTAPIWLHGGPYAEGDRVYCGWSRAGMVVLDISDIRSPTVASQLGFYPPLGSSIGAHTVVPLPDRKLALVNSEALTEQADEPLAFVGLVDLSVESDPILISLFPRPEVPEGYPLRDFTDRRVRFGPHNQHQPQHQPHLWPGDDLVFLTYFSGGLQIYDISNPRAPRIVGYHVPDDPTERLGPTPTDLGPQYEDVIVDRRGNIFVSERNGGVDVLRRC